MVFWNREKKDIECTFTLNLILFNMLLKQEQKADFKLLKMPSFMWSVHLAELKRESK